MFILFIDLILFVRFLGVSFNYYFPVKLHLSGQIPKNSPEHRKVMHCKEKRKIVNGQPEFLAGMMYISGKINGCKTLSKR